VSIIIPALHRPDLTRRCLSSLAGQTFPSGSFEIIIVENEARAETMLPDPLPANVRRIALLDNYGTTGSINRGMADSQSEYVLLLNNDVELDSSFLATLVSAMEGNEWCGFCTGKLINAQNTTLLDGVGDAILLGGGVYRLGHADFDLGQFHSPFHVLAGCGAATLFRRSVLEEIGGLDEDFFAYLDDVDVALRARLMGYSGICVPQATARHIGSATLKEAFHPRIVEWLTRNQILLIAKTYPTAVLLRVLPQIITFQMLWVVLVLRRTRVIAYTKGLLGALRLLPRIVAKRRELMRTRKIDNRDFMNALRSSEKQVFEWHYERSRGERSTLLKFYFCLFKPKAHS
jgi:GT2 family glycosyltransferase